MRFRDVAAVFSKFPRVTLIAAAAMIFVSVSQARGWEELGFEETLEHDEPYNCNTDPGYGCNSGDYEATCWEDCKRYFGNPYYKFSDDTHERLRCDLIRCHWNNLLLAKALFCTYKCKAALLGE